MRVTCSQIREGIAVLAGLRRQHVAKPILYYSTQWLACLPCVTLGACKQFVMNIDRYLHIPILAIW